jgi:hypothetical protein
MNKSNVNKFLLGSLKKVNGSASKPQSGDNRTVVLFCVDGTGEGIFEIFEKNAEVAKSWEKAKSLYRAWWRSQMNFKKGEVQTTHIQSDTELAHLITCTTLKGKVVFDQEALEKSFKTLAKHCAENKTNVHINKVGSDSEWLAVMKVVEETLLTKGVNVYIYE